MRYKHLYLWKIFRLAVVLQMVLGCGKTPPGNKIVWRTDAAPVEKRIPLVGAVGSCIWHGGQKSEPSGRELPAPSEYFICGYIQVSEELKGKLMNDYVWQEVSIDAGEIDRPGVSSFADAFFTGQKYVQSEEFMRDHAKKSSFSAGRFIFCPDVNILYFDLSDY